MDERLKKALDVANYMKIINAHKKNIYNRYEVLLLVNYSDGLFVADDRTIGLVNALVNNNIYKRQIQDSNNIPIMIEDMKKFLEILLDSNFVAVNYLDSELKKLNEKRNIESILEI